MSGLVKYLERIHVSKPQDNECERAPEVSEEDEPTKGQMIGVDEEESVARDLKASIARIEKSISRSPLLEAYQFNQDDLLLIAEICHRAIEHGDQDFNMKDICGMLPDRKGASEERLNCVVNLIDREILTAPCLRDHDFHYDPRSLYSTFLRLNGLLWNLIVGKDPLQYASRIFSKAKSEDAIDTILKMIDAFFLHYPELDDSSPAEAGVCFGRSVNIALDGFLAKFDESNDPIWKAFKAKFRLNRYWLKCLALIHYHNKYRANEPSPEVIASLLAKNCQERVKYVELLGMNNVLAQKDLINTRIPVCSGYPMELTEMANNVLHGKANATKAQSSKADQLLDRSPYLNRINPAQTLDQLIVDSQTKSIIVSVINRLKNPRLESFSTWGLVGASLTSDPDIQHGCNILLHGVPGTGKTFIAGVFANELKRSLIQINANSIRGMFYGESEKQAREMFQEMRTLAKSKSPVFLLNEGDQLIHQRMASAERSVDHAENTIQSIFLEEMESFPGIIIVTTNLCAEMDIAMSRRFHYKLEIKVPDREARMALWQLHLPCSIPGAKSIPLECLAKDFHFTGGQIRLVVQNACHEAFLRGKGAKLTQDDLYRYARLENGSSFEQRKQPLGFAC